MAINERKCPHCKKTMIFHNHCENCGAPADDVHMPPKEAEGDDRDRTAREEQNER